MSWSLNEILADQDASAAFRAYLQTQHAAENYDFLRDVAAYRQAPSRAGARQIYAQYVTDDAATQVNISGASRTGLDEQLQDDLALGAPPADLFNAAARDVASPTADYIPAFVLTPAGAPYTVGADDMAAALAAAEAAAGGADGIDAPPHAPDAPPDAGPQPDPADNPNADDRGDDHDHDESKSDGREVVAEK
jgi:hypothetical protein